MLRSSERQCDKRIDPRDHLEITSCGGRQAAFSLAPASPSQHRSTQKASSKRSPRLWKRQCSRKRQSSCMYHASLAQEGVFKTYSRLRSTSPGRCQLGSDFRRYRCSRRLYRYRLHLYRRHCPATMNRLTKQKKARLLSRMSRRPQFLLGWPIVPLLRSSALRRSLGSRYHPM